MNDWDWNAKILESAHDTLSRLVLEEAPCAVGGAAFYESPIEYVMARSLFVVGRMLYASDMSFIPLEARKERDDFPPVTDVNCRGFVLSQSRELKPDLLVFPQVRIEPYCVDFLAMWPCAGAGGATGLVIECDGHDYHERTKEQAARDRARDRYLQTRGYKVFRFTGAEIWANPIECANEALGEAYSGLVNYWADAPKQLEAPEANSA